MKNVNETPTTKEGIRNRKNEKSNSRKYLGEKMIEKNCLETKKCVKILNYYGKEGKGSAGKKNKTKTEKKHKNILKVIWLS